MLARDREIGCVVLLQLLPAFGAVEQHEGREVRQFDSFVKDQRGFHAAVGEKNAAVDVAAGRVGIWPFNISVIGNLDTSVPHRTAASG